MKKLSHPVDIAPLVVFRVTFGLIMLISMFRFVMNGWVHQQYIQPTFYFSYYGFDWIRPLPGIGMYIVFSLLIILALLVMVGLFYRVAVTSFFVLFNYTELIDKTNYLNHYYFISIVAFLLILLPAHRHFSLDVWRNPRIKRLNVPRWTIDLLKLQLGIVYFYAGVAKLNPDWMLDAMPLKLWLPVHSDMFLIGPLFKQTWVAYAFSWFGALYDLSVPFFLVNKSTRRWAYLAVVAFHMITWMLFPIGMFPFIMIGATLIFFPASFHGKVISYTTILLRSIGMKVKRFPVTQHTASFSTNRVIYGVLAFHILLQVLIPWRFMLYPGHLFWTEQGYRFSWRVMLMEKAGYVVFHITDPQTGKRSDAFATDYLTPYQNKMMTTQPDMILQFAHFLKKVYEKKGIKDPEVRAEAYVTLNGKGSRLYLDPTVDLTKEQQGFRHKDWILPYEHKSNLTER